MSTATPPMPPQPISGVVPAEVKETTVMTVWPSNAALGLGRALGQAYAITWPDVYFLRLGRLIALLSIPLAMALYFVKVLPGIGTRYRLTNRRVIVERGLTGKEEKSVDLDRFERIEVDIRPGQEWYDAGDLVFWRGNVETFRLEGVSRPAAFRQTCLKAHLAHVGVVMAQQRQRR